jgi:hypothetical protein
MRRWTIINVLLLVMVALLGVEIYRTWARGLPSVVVHPRPPAPERPDGRRAGTERGGARAHQPPAGLVAAIAEKDLFDPSRRAPAEAAVPEAARETGPPPGLRVVGVRILGGDREAFVTDANQGNQQRRLRVGDQIAGYTVKTIEATALGLVSPSGDPVTMPLEVEAGKGGTVGVRPVVRAPTPGQAPVSPAAGIQATSPAAGVPVAPPAAAAVPPVPAAVRRPVRRARRPERQGLPADVRERLEQLRQRRNDPARLGGRD